MPAGRPQFEPTDADRKTVSYMIVAGLTLDRIAECLGEEGIDRGTLSKHFARELAVGRDQVTGRCVGKLVDAIDKGEAWAICFYLKTRCGWKETQVTEHAGSLNVNSSGTEVLTSRIASIASRSGSGSGDQEPVK